MLARQVVLLTHPKSSHPFQLLSRQQTAPVSPLPAILMDLPASVANKRLTASLNPLDAILTKTWGGGSSAPCFDSSTFNSSTLRLFHDEPFRRSLLSFFAPRVFHNSFAIKPFHTLSQKCRVSPPPWSLYLKYYFNSSANSLLIPFPTFQPSSGLFSSRRSDVQTFRHSDEAPLFCRRPLPFPIRCILFVPNRAGT
jgi:hypothetical protein